MGSTITQTHHRSLSPAAPPPTSAPTSTHTDATTIDPILLLDSLDATFAFDNMSSSTMAKQHNACDECRSRKLRCSGELSGCARCRTDRVECVYSPRKQMGRPRKKRNDSNPQPATYEVWPMNSSSGGVSSGIDSPGGFGAGNSGSSNIMFSTQTSPPPPQTFGGGLGNPDMNYDFGNMNLDFLSSTTSPPPPPSSASYALSMPPLDPTMDFSSLAFPSQPFPSSPWQQPTYTTPSPGYSFPPPTSPPYLSSPPLTNSPSPLVAPASCTCTSAFTQTVSTLPHSTSHPTYPRTLQPLKHATAVTSLLFHCQTCPQNYATALQNSMGSVTLLAMILRGYQGLISHVESRARKEARIVLHLDDFNDPTSAMTHTQSMNYSMGSTIELSGAEWRSRALKSIRKEVFGRDIVPTSSKDVVPDSLLGVARGLRDRQRAWHKDRRFMGEEQMHHHHHRGLSDEDDGNGQSKGKCICAQGLHFERLVQGIMQLRI